MKNSETPFFVGYVEQGLGGSQDPLSPPISISRNGTLAKWRGKFNFLDLRVNDPGLKKNYDAFAEIIQKTSVLGIETIITLPEFSLLYFDLPPLPPEDLDKPIVKGRKSTVKRPEKLVFFRPSYLSLSASVEGSVSYHKLSVDECLPVLELAAKFGVKKVIVPVSEPGKYLDRMAEDNFCKQFAKLYEYANANGISLHLRNGGLSEALFKKLNKKFKCGLVYNVGIAHLESDDILENYKKLSDDITIIALQQVLPGLDRYDARRKRMEDALKNYVIAKKEYRQALVEGDEHYVARCLKRFNGALRGYYDSFKNSDYNLGLFQNGDLNLVPLIKEIKKDLDGGTEKYLLLETVPNTKNTDFLLRYLMPEGFPGAF